MFRTMPKVAPKANAKADGFHTIAKADAKVVTKAKAKAKAKVATKAKARTSTSPTPKAKAEGTSPTKKMPAAALEEPSGAPFVVCVLACVHKYPCFKSQMT